MSEIYPTKAEKWQSWKLYVKADLQAKVTQVRVG